jgi:hypothetical protein
MPVSSQVRQQQLRAAIRAQQSTPYTITYGQVASVNGDGTVQVYIAGDTVAVTAYTVASYVPAAGDLVKITRSRGHAVVDGKIANATDVAAQAATAATLNKVTTGVASTLVQGVTAFLGSVMWGAVPANETLLYPAIGAAGVTTTSAGVWTLPLPYNYTTGWAGTCSAGITAAAIVAFNQTACTGNLISGQAWGSNGTLIVGAEIVVGFNLLGA